MSWQQMLDGVRNGSFFGDLGNLEPEELADRLRWTALFTTDRLWSWLKQDNWASDSAIPRNDDIAKHALTVLLERRLLNLDTRFCPDPLFEFWDWLMRASRCEKKDIVKLWRDNEQALRSCCSEGELSLVAIVAQEKNFAQLLRRAEVVLRGVPSNLRWAFDTVARLAARLSGGEVDHIPNRACARVVFAWEECKLPKEFRPALLVDLELQNQGDGEPYILPEDVFCNDFRNTVNYVADKIVRRHRFHRLELQPLSETVHIPGLGENGERCIELPEDCLKGESGGLAILLTQILANRATGLLRKHWYSLPPWVVVMATLDPKAKELARSVGAIDPKIRLLREEGVRIIVVADESSQLTEVKYVLDSFSSKHGMAVVRAARKSKETAKSLIEANCAWETDIEKPPIITRRRFIVAALAAGGGFAAGKYFIGERRPQTLAMRRHKRKEMQAAAQQIKDEYLKHPKPGAEPYFREVLKAEEVDAFPAQTSWDGLEILKKSVHFDSCDWDEVLSVEALKQNPIEPAYSTTVWELRKPDPKTAPTHFALEGNTSGFGVIPVPISSLVPRIYYRTNKKMHESKQPGHITLTTYRVYDISDLGNDGKAFLLEDHVIYFNGTQDQTLRGAAYDWWGTRLPPSALSADLSVELPAKRNFVSVIHVVRKEDKSGRLIPVQKINEGDLLWSPAGDSDGTYVDGSVVVWTIPCDPPKMEEFHWIYSIQWKWK